MLRVLHSSDLHGSYKDLLRKLNEGNYDVWIDTGDFFPNKTRGFAPVEVVHQRRWFQVYKRLGERIAEALNGKPLISVSGNHDYVSLARLCAEAGAETHDLSVGHCAQVCGLKFAGFREINWIAGEWKGETPDLRPVVDNAMLHDPDILVTHAPPQGILDGEFGYGIASLTSELMYRNHRIKAHLFGHTHAHGGCSTERAGIQFYNGATTTTLISI